VALKYDDIAPVQTATTVTDIVDAEGVLHSGATPESATRTSSESTESQTAIVDAADLEDALEVLETLTPAFSI
jgi:hypothetical protein